MRDKIVDDLMKAIVAAAATFDKRGSTIKERELEMALEVGLRALGREPIRQFRVHLEQCWSGRVGGVDLALESSGGPVLIELKWDTDTLAACAWDSVKLAAALQTGEASRAFLIAGSPIRDGLCGDELLDDAEIQPRELRQRYVKDFDFWKGDVKNRPVQAPGHWRVQCLQHAPFHFKELPWRLRLAEVTLRDRTLTRFE